MALGAFLLLRREREEQWREADFLAAAAPKAYPAPVDRTRVVRRDPDKNASAAGGGGGGGVAVAQMALSPIGAEHAPQWPLFWVLTVPRNERRCAEIVAAWGSVVPPDSLIFIGAAANRTSARGHRFVALPVPPERKALKELLAWRFVTEAYPDREWYVKGDDDTYFVVRNLNRYLEEFDPRLPYFLGCKFHLGGPGGVQYVSGGAGYVLSREAARRLAPASVRCVQHYGGASEGDLAVAECLQTVGVTPEDTRDDRGRQRFHAFPYVYHLDWYTSGFHLRNFWYHDWVWGPEVEGPGCCGENTTVSFHYMQDQMQEFDFPHRPKPTLSALAALKQLAGLGRPPPSLPQLGDGGGAPPAPAPDVRLPARRPFGMIRGRADRGRRSQGATVPPEQPRPTATPAEGVG